MNRLPDCTLKCRAAWQLNKHRVVNQMALWQFLNIAWTAVWHRDRLGAVLAWLCGSEQSFWWDIEERAPLSSNSLTCKISMGLVMSMTIRVPAAFTRLTISCLRVWKIPKEKDGVQRFCFTFNDLFCLYTLIIIIMIIIVHLSCARHCPEHSHDTY